MRIFISYARRDAGDFAEDVHDYLKDLEYEVFTDIKNIVAGEDWTKSIEQNLSNCDIFVVIITHSALKSQAVAKEIEQAKKEKKTIIPCFYEDIEKSTVKYGLDKIQGIVFKDTYSLKRNLYKQIKKIKRTSNKNEDRSFNLRDNNLTELDTIDVFPSSGLNITSSWWICQVCGAKFHSHPEYAAHFSKFHK